MSFPSILDNTENFIGVNSHFRNLNWSYLPCIWGLCKAYGSGDLPAKIIHHFRILEFPLIFVCPLCVRLYCTSFGWFFSPNLGIEIPAGIWRPKSLGWLFQGKSSPETSQIFPCQLTKNEDRGSRCLGQRATCTCYIHNPDLWWAKSLVMVINYKVISHHLPLKSHWWLTSRISITININSCITIRGEVLPEVHLGVFCVSFRFTRRGFIWG